MRQTGLMAASAAYALTYNFPRLVDVHLMARRLDQGLREIGVEVTSEAETCMVRLPLCLRPGCCANVPLPCRSSSTPRPSA